MLVSGWSPASWRVWVPYLLKEVLWDLGGLPRACLAFNDEDLVISNGSQELLTKGEHREAAADSLDRLLLLGLGWHRWGGWLLRRRKGHELQASPILLEMSLSSHLTSSPCS